MSIENNLLPDVGTSMMCRGIERTRDVLSLKSREGIVACLGVVVVGSTRRMYQNVA